VNEKKIEDDEWSLKLLTLFNEEWYRHTFKVSAHLFGINTPSYLYLKGLKQSFDHGGIPTPFRYSTKPSESDIPIFNYDRNPHNVPKSISNEDNT
jgi:hypothetical protein